VPSWNELLDEFNAQADDNARASWMGDQTTRSLQTIGTLRGDRNVVLYASAFLQKPQLPGHLVGISHEDVNALMSVFYGMDWSKGLTLILHTPGGVTNAAETIVAYIRSKFDRFEVIVPTYAMSAGTMISLAADCIVMGRQSQLGPIDPQLFMRDRQASAMAIVEQFELAKADILANKDLAHVWAPILQSHGPSLLMEARNALDYGERMVATWLETWLLAGESDRATRAKAIAKYFNDATNHKSHGRRIDRVEAADQGLNILALEDDQSLQEAVLSAYHLATIVMEHSPAAKVFWTSQGRQFIKNA
jgi:Serine dehydrogenase proteinase